jgi:2-polyprenyl-6-methoxyphenol hydroxylase-like FAD-dependent oxidoreductase
VRIAVVGGGTAGPAAALFLARDGHAVEMFERVAEPRGVGAGIVLQALGQRVLDELGLAAELERRSSPVRHVDGRTRSGRRVLDFAFHDVVRNACGWGVHRGTLFELLWAAVRGAGIPTETGVEVTGLRLALGGYELVTADGQRGPFDLVVGADGARSKLRRLSGLATKDAGYPYGALWAIVPDPDGLAGDVLFQRYDGTRVMLGIVPTGVGGASIFWSIPARRIAAARAAGTAAWIRVARPYADGLAPLVDRVAETGLMGARYRDVVVRSPVLVNGSGRRASGLVLVGDAGHGMSPQLGLGAGFALADAWVLAACLRSWPDDLGLALERYAEDRRSHIRYYTWCSRFLTPVFQSGLVPIGWLRDAFLGPVGRIPLVRREFEALCTGMRTLPFTSWREPGAAGSD